MAPPRKFDHDEARKLRAEGMSYKAIARQLGVTHSAIERVVNEKTRARMHAASLNNLRRRRQPCLGGCGRLVWSHMKGRTGYCAICLGARKAEETPHGTASKYQYGCRCDACRYASAEQKRLWRAANRERARDWEHQRYLRRKAAA